MGYTAQESRFDFWQVQEILVLKKLPDLLLYPPNLLCSGHWRLFFFLEGGDNANGA